MNVRQAMNLAHQRCGIPAVLDFASNREIGDPILFALLDIRHWLFDVSRAAMEAKYGPAYGWNESLPEDIDKATVLTAEQETEFYRRLKTLPKGGK